MTQQPMQPPPYAVPPNHPQATTILVLGILGILVCGLVGPFAWTMGNRVVAEIDAAGGRIGGRTEANVGRILGIVATALLLVGVLVFVVFIAFSGVVMGGMLHSSNG